MSNTALGRGAARKDWRKVGYKYREMQRRSPCAESKAWLERGRKLTMKRLLIMRSCEPIVRFTCCSVRYGECRRNHAASSGGYAIDGCLEFIAEGEESTSGALKCAACGCHRSFHRRVQVYEVAWDYGSDTSSTE